MRAFSSHIPLCISTILFSSLWLTTQFILSKAGNLHRAFNSQALAMEFNSLNFKVFLLSDSSLHNGDNSLQGCSLSPANLLPYRRFWPPYGCGRPLVHKCHRASDTLLFPWYVYSDLHVTMSYILRSLLLVSFGTSNHGANTTTYSAASIARQTNSATSKALMQVLVFLAACCNVRRLLAPHPSGPTGSSATAYPQFSNLTDWTANLPEDSQRIYRPQPGT